MKAKRKQPGLTLTEMTVVIMTIVILLGLGLPAIRALLASFESQSSTTSMISAALASARAIAAKNQRYAGIRFQKANQAQDPLQAAQYMIFVVQDPDMMAYGFRAVQGLRPIRLPDSVGVTDLTIVTNRNATNPTNSVEVRLDDAGLSNPDILIDENHELIDLTTFSILFSPSGKLVIHGIRVRNKDGQSDNSATISYDDVFNKKTQVDAAVGMFYQDDYFGAAWSSYANLGLGPEPSRSSFVIYEKKKFIQAYRKGRAWSDCLIKLMPDAIYINPYTGTIINQ